MPQMPPSDRTDCRYGHAAQPHAAVHLVLGRLSGHQPYPRHIGCQVQRQLGLSRYETAFQILHELRAGMVRPDQNRVGGRANDMSRWTKPASAVGHAANAEAFTTRS